ncbi:hypothetical protein ABMA70_12950 [Halobacteriovorax sp. XZX-3]|uniref:hypothetical protein n=1 Tax=unclassified Halobacteriovorax TaxID=2639665 RepID=UPI003722C22B
MRMLLVTLLVLGNFLSFAGEFTPMSTYDVCDSQDSSWTSQSSDGYEKCMEIVDVGFFDRNAVAVCYAISESWSSQIGEANDCLSFIKNKEFENSRQLESCYKKVSWSSRAGSALKCLKESKYINL